MVPILHSDIFGIKCNTHSTLCYISAGPQWRYDLHNWPGGCTSSVSVGSLHNTPRSLAAAECSTIGSTTQLNNREKEWASPTETAMGFRSFSKMLRMSVWICMFCQPRMLASSPKPIGYRRPIAIRSSKTRHCAPLLRYRQLSSKWISTLKGGHEFRGTTAWSWSPSSRPSLAPVAGWQSTNQGCRGCSGGGRRIWLMLAPWTKRRCCCLAPVGHIQGLKHYKNKYDNAF